MTTQTPELKAALKILRARGYKGRVVSTGQSPFEWSITLEDHGKRMRHYVSKTELAENPIARKRRTKRKSSKGRGKITRLKNNPPFGKRKRIGARHRDQRRVPTALEVNQMASSLGLRGMTLDELIAMYNKHRKMPASNFIAKVIAEAAKQVAITKGAKVVKS